MTEDPSIEVEWLTPAELLAFFGLDYPFKHILYDTTLVPHYYIHRDVVYDGTVWNQYQVMWKGLLPLLERSSCHADEEAKASKTVRPMYTVGLIKLQHSHPVPLDLGGGHMYPGMRTRISIPVHCGWEYLEENS